jgi:tripartite-type tricarboxylate transporter receptor subunit TctC
MNRRIALLWSAFLVATHPSAFAVDAVWPTKPVRIIVPGGPGGVTDIRARWLADRLMPALGQSVIVENKPGAGGNIGTEMGARSAPDGYTLTIIHQGTMAINPHLYSRLGYDPLADFAPITHLGVGPLLLTVNLEVPAASVAALVQLAKAKPGQLNFGSPGTGTPPHLAGELFKHVAGIDVVHVPYNGGGQSATALISGQVSFMIEGLSVVLPLVKAGRLRPLAVTGPRRVASLPDVPTMAEAGLPSYEFIGWVGISAPAATPKPIIDRLYREIGKILATAEARDWFGAIGAEPLADTPEAFAAAIRAEHVKWGRVIREAGIRIE